MKITKKVAFNIASEASCVYIMNGQKLIENAKMDNFGDFLKTGGLRSNSVAGQVSKNSPKLTILGIFNELLSTQNVNVARFAGNDE